MQMLFNTLLVSFLLLISLCTGISFALTDDEVAKLQSSLKGIPVGDRIALSAEKFIGTPYDIDPLGKYVTERVIVADDRIDCMYLTFRAVELAMSNTPEDAVRVALDKRFVSKGILENGRVINYDNRFEYGEDMISSRKWGNEITSEIAKPVKIKGTRGRDFVEIAPPEELLKNERKLRNGDLIFLIKNPQKKARGEIVGHIGIIKKEYEKIYLIHASGKKGKGGVVKKVLFKDYIKKMPFIGAKITRFR